MQRTDVNEGIILYFEPVNPEFDRDFADDSRVMLGVDMSVDVRVKFNVGVQTPAYAHSGRTLLKLKAANGSQVFIRNAQVKMLEDDRVQITFYRHEQMTAQMTASQQRESLWTPEMQKQLTAETEAIENKAFSATADQVLEAEKSTSKAWAIANREYLEAAGIDALPPVCRTCGDSYAEAGDGYDGECPTCADRTAEEEEEDPVFVLWEGGAIEEFKNADDARDEIMAMESRGCTYMKFSSLAEAEEALANMAAAFLKKQ